MLFSDKNSREVKDHFLNVLKWAAFEYKYAWRSHTPLPSKYAIDLSILRKNPLGAPISYLYNMIPIARYLLGIPVSKCRQKEVAPVNFCFIERSINLKSREESCLVSSSQCTSEDESEPAVMAN